MSQTLNLKPRPSSKATPSKTRRSSAAVIDLDVVRALAETGLARKAIAGDVPSMIAWLERYASQHDD
jgi:hypothetical protein